MGGRERWAELWTINTVLINRALPLVFFHCLPFQTAIVTEISQSLTNIQSHTKIQETWKRGWCSPFGSKLIHRLIAKITSVYATLVLSNAGAWTQGHVHAIPAVIMLNPSASPRPQQFSLFFFFFLAYKTKYRKTRSLLIQFVLLFRNSISNFMTESPIKMGFCCSIYVRLPGFFETGSPQSSSPWIYM